VNTEALKNVRFRSSLSFYNVGDVVVALCNPVQTCLQPCYKYGGRNLSSERNYFEIAFVLILPCFHQLILVTLYTFLRICFRPKSLNVSMLLM
jgi:hypothetical protein